MARRYLYSVSTLSLYTFYVDTRRCIGRRWAPRVEMPKVSLGPEPSVHTKAAVGTFVRTHTTRRQNSVESASRERTTQTRALFNSEQNSAPLTSSSSPFPKRAETKRLLLLLRTYTLNSSLLWHFTAWAYVRYVCTTRDLPSSQAE